MRYWPVDRRDGEALGRIVKADPELKATQLVMISSAGQRGDAKRMPQAGFSAYLSKPAYQSQILDVLQTVWANSKEASPSMALVTRHTLQERASSTGIALPISGTIFSARVLVVEDNPINQKVASKTLERLGCRIDLAADGRKGVEMAFQFPYDIIFIDCQMPEMDGYEATAEIRRREGSEAHRIIVAMTANAMQGDRDRCIAAGMDDYVSKPVSRPDLAIILNRYVRSWPEDESSAIPVIESSKI